MSFQPKGFGFASPIETSYWAHSRNQGSGMDDRRVVKTRCEPRNGMLSETWIRLRSCRLKSALQQSWLLSRPLLATFDPFRLRLKSVAGWVVVGDEHAVEQSLHPQAKGPSPG